MRVVLVDDEKFALDLLENLLKKIENIEIVGKYTEPIKAQNDILSKNVDVLFLDIHQPEMNGLELAEQIIEIKPEMVVVFVTAYDEYAVQAFEINALDYLLKPVSFNRLEKTITRIKNHLTPENTKPIMKEEKVKVSVFRQLMIKTTNDDRFQSIRWRTKKAQELFLYLLHYRNQLVRKSVLAELLWPDYDSERSHSQLYTTVYHIRKTLKDFSSCFTIKNTTEGYILKVDNVLIDVEEWEEGLSNLSELHNGTIDQYVKVMKKYKGGYLQEYNYWWSEAERHRLETMWLNVAFQIADWYYENELLYEAITWYEKICVEQPESEEAYLSLMQIYASLGETLIVQKKYHQLKAILKEELHTEPSDDIINWYNKWIKNAKIS